MCTANICIIMTFARGLIAETSARPFGGADILQHDKRLRAHRFRVPGHDGAVRHAAKAYVI